MARQPEIPRGTKEELRRGYSEVESAAFEIILNSLRNHQWSLHKAMREMNEVSEIKRLGRHIELHGLKEITESKPWKKWYDDYIHISMLAKNADAYRMVPSALAKQIALQYTRDHSIDETAHFRVAEQTAKVMKGEAPTEGEFFGDNDELE